jgi:PAS domain S-box-containing protein
MSHKLSLGTDLSLYSNSAEGLFLIAVEGEQSFRLVSANKAFFTITCTEEQDVVGKLVHEIMPESRALQFCTACVEAIRDKTAHRWEEEFQCCDETRVKTISVMPVFQGENCTHVFGSLHDITVKKRTEAALRDETRILVLLNETGRRMGSTLDLPDDGKIDLTLSVAGPRFSYPKRAEITVLQGGDG